MCALHSIPAGGFQRTPGVIVIGASNFAQNVDPALKRPGRLDKCVEVALPDEVGRAEIIVHYLRGSVAEIDTDQVLRLGKMSSGMSGADLERVIRDARRIAGNGERGMTFALLSRALYGIDNRSRQPEEVRARVAYLQAGHVLASMLGKKRGADLNFIAIDHEAGSGIGFLSRDAAPGDGVSTRVSLEEQIQWLLSGRAAEALVYGENNLSTLSAANLARATDLAWQMHTSLALGQSGSLLAVGGNVPYSASDVGWAESLLQDAYRRIQKQLRLHREVLERLQQALLKEGYLTGDAARETCRACHAEAPSATIAVLSEYRQRRGGKPDRGYSL